MDDDGPTATAFLLIFVVMILIDVLFYGFGASIENLKPEDINRLDKDKDDNGSAHLIREQIIQQFSFFRNAYVVILTPKSDYS